MRNSHILTGLAAAALLSGGLLTPSHRPARPRPLRGDKLEDALNGAPPSAITDPPMKRKRFKHNRRG